VGSTGFFLDYAERIALNPDQQATLNQIREEALSHQSAFSRQIQQAEEDLWRLTAIDQPNLSAITSQIKKIESLRSERRVRFIRSIGDAAKVLSTHQREMLLGKVRSDGNTAPSKGPSEQQAGTS
jgi:Spy/CpxP family protein refolding chaperone